MLPRCTCTLWLAAMSLFWWPTANAWSQPAEEAPPAPPLLSERTHEQVEQFLAQAPPEEKTSGKPGLRVFTISQVEPAALLAVLIAGCASLFLVAPGAFLIYAAVERRSISGEQLRSSAAVLAVMSLAWILLLYSLAFTRNAHSYDVLEKEIEVVDRATAPGSIFMGDLSRAGLRGMSSHWTAGRVRHPLRRLEDPIPEIHFMTFQLTIFLQAIVPLLVVTTRSLRSWNHFFFWLLWSAIVFAPVTYWTQGGGWLAECVDAGSTVPLHICVGFTALGLMLFQGRTASLTDTSTTGNAATRLDYLVMGASLFLSGSLLLAGGRSLAFYPWATSGWLNVILATCAGLLTWMLLDQRLGNRDRSAPLFGAVSGITAIAAGHSSVSPGFAIALALAASLGSYAVLHSWKSRLSRAAWRLFAVHGVSAFIGLVLTGVLATPDVAGVDSSGRPIVGLISGNPDLWRVQLLAGSLAAGISLAAGMFLPTILSRIERLLARDETAEKTTRDVETDQSFVAIP